MTEDDALKILDEVLVPSQSITHLQARQFTDPYLPCGLYVMETALKSWGHIPKFKGRICDRLIDFMTIDRRR